MDQEIIALVQRIISMNPVLAYVFFFFNAMLQVLFPPYPGDTVIVLSGYLSSTGILNTPLVILITLLSTYISSIFLYLMSFNFSDRIHANKFIGRFFNLKSIYKTEGWFKKYGAVAIIINKFLPGVSSVTLIAAGIFKLPPKPASITIAAAVIIHNIFLFMAGRITGNNMDFLKQTISRYNKYFIIILFIIAAVYMIIKFIRKKYHKNTP